MWRFLGFICAVGVLVLVLAPGSVTADWDNANVYCAFPAGTAFAGDNIFVRYEGTNSGRVVLVSYQTGQVVQVLETNLQTERLDVRDWSDDCRYVLATTGLVGQQQTLAWDAFENRRVGSLTTGHHSYGRFGTIWEDAFGPTTVLIQSQNGLFRWNVATNAQVRYDLPGPNGRVLGSGNRFTDQPFYDIDFGRGQLLVRANMMHPALVVLDLYSGAVLHTLTNDPLALDLYFRVTDTHVAILDRLNPTPGTAAYFDALVWDRDTYTAQRLSRVYTAMLMGPASPSGRYLVFGNSLLQVYDLWAADPNLPIVEYEFDNGNLPPGVPYVPRRTRFVGEDTVQYLRWEFTCYLNCPNTDGFTLGEYDVPSDTQTFLRFYPIGVCTDRSSVRADDPALRTDLLDWACSTVYQLDGEWFVR